MLVETFRGFWCVWPHGTWVPKIYWRDTCWRWRWSTSCGNTSLSKEWFPFPFFFQPIVHQMVMRAGDLSLYLLIVPRALGIRTCQHQHQQSYVHPLPCELTAQQELRGHVFLAPTPQFYVALFGGSLSHGTRFETPVFPGWNVRRSTHLLTDIAQEMMMMMMVMMMVMMMMWWWWWWCNCSVLMPYATVGLSAVTNPPFIGNVPFPRR